MRPNRIYLIILLVTIISFNGNAQNQRPIGHIGFYNVENLFDLLDDPKINDDDFTPKGKLKWDTTKYVKKLNNVTKVFKSMATPDIIGVCEIENRSVLESIVSHPSLARYKYQIVHFDSPDHRGIDVALLYRSNKFVPFYSKNITFKDNKPSDFTTRDILHVKGLYHGDTLNVFVNHWPSRRGGKEDKRILAALTLRGAIDSLQKSNPDAKFVIMGDLNDDPNNKSVKKNLLASNNLKKLGEKGLYNTSTKTFKGGFGTLFYRGTWNLFDQIIISQSMLKQNSKTWYYKPDSFKVFAPEWMRVKEGEYQGAPFRTFVGGKFQGGFSDHYPVFIEITK